MLLVPRFVKRNFVTIILFDIIAGFNPVEAAPQIVSSTRGNYSVSIQDTTTGFTCSFEMSGGFSGNPLANLSNFTVLTNTFTLCNVTSTLIPNTFTIVTDATDSGGRTYSLVMQKYPSVSATLEKTAGAVLAGNLKVTFQDCAPENNNFSISS